jgi:hypothetical protein
MAEPATMKLELRLTPSSGEPNAEVLDDLVKLVRQAVVTAPPDSLKIQTEGEFVPPEGEQEKSLRGLESRIKYRIEQAAGASQMLIEQREATSGQPDGAAKLAAEATFAAQAVVAAVQRARLRGVAVTTS